MIQSQIYIYIYINIYFFFYARIHTKTTTTRGIAINFFWGEPTCDTNLLAYTNFHTYAQT